MEVAVVLVVMVWPVELLVVVVVVLMAAVVAVRVGALMEPPVVAQAQ